MLLVNSEKGRDLFERTKKSMEVYEKDFNSIFTGNPMFTTSVVVPVESNNFLRDLDSMPFSECIRKYSRGLLWQKVFEKAKQAIKKLWGKTRDL